MRYFLPFLFLCALFVSNAMASHKIYSDIRYRYEYQHNFNKKFYCIFH